MNFYFLIALIHFFFFLNRLLRKSSGQLSPIVTLAMKSSWNMYRIYMIFFFCVLKYWTHVVWGFYPSLKYMFSLLYHTWGKIYVLINEGASCWPLLQLALKSFCLPNPSNSKLKFIWSIRSISLWYNGRGVLFWDINRDFSLLQFYCCLKSFATLVSVFHCFGVETHSPAQKTDWDWISKWIFRKHKRSNNLKVSAHYFERVRFLREQSCFLL